MKKKRMLNGYVAIYEPDNPSAYTCGNWSGYVYEHRSIAEKMLGRQLTSEEVVHHLDCDKTNNNPNNIIVLVDKASHIRLHNWIDVGAPIHDTYEKKSHMNTHYVILPICEVPECHNTVKETRHRFCSVECVNKDQQKNIPSEIELIKLLMYNSFLQVSKLYDVSDNAVRKWVAHYGHDPKTIRKELKDILNKKH